MKTTTSLTVLAAVALASIALVQAQVLSPRAEANKTRIVAGTNSDVDLVNKAAGPALSPRAQATVTKVTPRSDHEGDSLAATRNSRLSPRAQSQLGTTKSFEVAPLGTKSKKDCTTGGCCKK